MSLLNSSLHGDIDTNGIAEDLQAIVRMTESGCLEVAYANDVGYVSFSGGKILAAITRQSAGITALREIVGWENGSFILEKSVQPAPTVGEINLPLTFALLMIQDPTMA
jgi:hypothetical protein